MHLALHQSPGVAAILIAAAARSMACSGASEGPDAGPPSIELGTGTRAFEPLVDGEDIFVVQGPQGGYHLVGSMRASNVDGGNPADLSDPNNPNTRFEVYLDDERVDAGASDYTQGLQEGQGGLEMIGRNVILDIADDSELEGLTLRFVVTLNDVNGIMLADDRTLIARAHPNNQ